MLTQRLGIVYTPVEVVDFILHSVNDVLKAQFGQTLGSEGVHILDPFTGTGTFISRLLQSGLIAPEELARKYREEIHANEIVLLAYYIAAINIETVYQERMQGELTDNTPYEPFKGILLTDTFQMYEQERDMVANLLPDNSERRTRQKALDIRVIIGNPPYSVGQKSDDDGASNVTYPRLNERLRETYVGSSTGNPRSLYDSYIKAIRWASDRVGKSGVVAFVSNAAWVETHAADGMRKCLVEEFSELYVFHLRGNQRTAGELSRKEGGKIFGSGSRAPIAISIFVKNPEVTEHGSVHFHDIGDYLDQKKKLNIIRNFASVDGVTAAQGWKKILPDENYDWLDQVDRSFNQFIEIGNKKDRDAISIFQTYSAGVKTNRDAWVYNASRLSLESSMRKMISYYNHGVEQGIKDSRELDDPKSLSWSWVLRQRFENGIKASYEDAKMVPSLYRPFTAQWLFYDSLLNENRYLIPRLFPTGHEDNPVISMTGVGAANFSVILTQMVPCLDLTAKSQCFPLYLYEETKPDDGLFATADGETGLTRRDAITDEGLAHFQASYPGETISKEDLFYYIYGLLHAPDYRERFKNNLAKALPRIPAVRTFADFAAFRDAGRALGDLHVNFESVEPYLVTFKEGDHNLINEAQDDPETFYRVTKMKGTSKNVAI